MKVGWRGEGGVGEVWRRGRRGVGVGLGRSKMEGGDRRGKEEGVCRRSRKGND